MILRLLVAYDGGGFRGFALNPGVRTVAGELKSALERVLRQPVSLTCAGRTDAGVHAWGQVVSIELLPPENAGAEDTRFSEETLLKLRDSLNKQCGPEIAIREVSLVAADFNARLDATQRTYRYSIYNHPVQNPHTAKQSWHIAQPLDISAMNEAAQHILGEHDFTSFCRQADGKSLVRRVNKAEWRHSRDSYGESSLDGYLVVLEIAASSFCHQMVRSLVGTFCDIGLGKHPPSSMAETLSAQNRQAASNLAPPHGLCLWHVDY